MIIGVPKEIKNNENRVGMTPSGVAEVVKQGHRVFIQHTAGVNSGFPDEAYQAVGAHVLPTIEDIYATAEMIVKVKEPIVTEYNLIRKGQLLFTYFHFASDKELTLAMLSNKSICLAYETVEEAIKERNSYADCVEYIVDEANKAAETLPVERSGNKFGRVTRGACKALISRVRLYAASKLFNGSDFAPTDFPKELLGYPTYDKERWKIAVDAALDVIRMKQYDLYIRNEDENNEAYPGWGYYAQLLPADYYGKVGTEVYCGTIFEKKAGASIDTNRWFAPPSTGGNGIGGYVYHDLAELFPMADGTPTKDSPDYDPTNPANKRDPRFMFTVTYDGCIMKSNMQDTEINISVGTQQDAIYRGTPTGYYTHKFLKFGSMANQMLYGGSQARPLMRYTEILLNYAEAANEYYGPDHKDVLGDQEISPYIVLRKIRECAGIEPGEDGTYGIENNMSQADMTEAIRLERRLDLAFEGHRFFDVRRWMIAEDTDNRMMHGFEITRNGEQKTGRIIDTRQHTFRKAMYFYPIPYKETVKSPDLLQNPYYE